MPAREPTEPRVRTTLHPLVAFGLIGAGVMMLLLVVGIAMLVVILKDSRDHIRAQDAKTAVLLGKVRAATPAARKVPPLLNDARPLVRQLGRAVGPVRQAVDATAEAIEDVPALVRATGAIADALLDRNRLAVALDSTNRLLAQVEAEDLVPTAARAARETPDLLRRLERIQLATLRTQRRSLRTQRATLEVQRQALVHIESIDRKTGGTVPTQGAPVPTP